MVVLAADHRGYTLKETLKDFLLQEGYDVVDVGASEKIATDDYPDFASAGALKVLENPGSRGVFLCGSGMGMDVVANKFKGIRATVAYSKDSAQHARERDGVNIITLAADVISPAEAWEIVGTFLSSEFDGAERNSRRLEKVKEVEEKNFK